MRIALIVTLLLTAVLIMVSFAAAEPPANELGRVMILEYHKVDYPEERWTRTPENFRRDLEVLYARGYRLQSLNDLLDGKITVKAGFTPIILTFDDSSPGQFRYLDQNGTLEIDPKSAVGVLEAFAREKPDFGRAATFFVLPGAGSQHAQFDPSAWTYRPANAGTYTDEGMGPLMAAAHPDAFTLIDRSASVAAPSCSASATKPSTPTWCAPSTASTRFWCSPDRRRRQTFSPRASCAPGGQSHVRWGNRA